MKKDIQTTGKEQKSIIPDRVNRLLNRTIWDPFSYFNWEPSLDIPSVFRGNAPMVDISESDKEITVKADVPGYDLKDISVEIEDDVLMIRGKTKEEKEEKDQYYLKRERMYGEFERRFTLPTYANTDEIKCESKNGILTINIPKKEESVRSSAKKIEIKTTS